MRPTEEKNLILIEIISLTFITLTGAGIQICDNKINDYHNDLFTKQINLNFIEGQKISQKMEEMKYLSAAFYNADVNVHYDEIEKNSELDEEARQIVNQYKNGEIDKIGYFNKLSIKHHEIVMGFQKQYLEAKSEIEKKLNSQPKSMIVKQALSSVQLIAILISIFIYIFLYKSISHRTK